MFGQLARVAKCLTCQDVIVQQTKWAVSTCNKIFEQLAHVAKG